MNAFAPIATLVAATLTLIACTTPTPPADPPADPPRVAIPPPEFQRDLPLEPPAMIHGRVCQLGTTCLALDPRPFEACLVGTRHCADKAREPLPVGAPSAPDEPAPMQIRK